MGETGKTEKRLFLGRIGPKSPSLFRSSFSVKINSFNFWFIFSSKYTIILTHKIWLKWLYFWQKLYQKL